MEAPSLLFTCQRYSDESLKSYLTRLAHINYYPLRLFTRMVQAHLQRQGPTDSLWFPQFPETLAFLATFTHTSLSDLCASIPGEDHIIRPESDLIYACPPCLREGAYHRVAWMCSRSVTCPIHSCLLVSRCRICHQSFTLDTIVQDRCQCGSPPSKTSPTPIAISPFTATMLDAVHAWQLGEPWLDALIQYGIPYAPPEQLFRVVWHVATFVYEAVRRWPPDLWPHAWLFPEYEQCRPLLRETVGDTLLGQKHMLEGGYILTQWPQMFHTFMTLCELLAWNEHAAAPCPVATQWLGVHLEGLTLGAPWVAEAYAAYYAARQVPLPPIRMTRYIDDLIDHIRDNSMYIPVTYACYLLDVDRPILEDLIVRGYVASHPAYPNRFVLRHDIQILGQRIL